MKIGRIGVAVAAWLTLFAGSGAASAQKSFPNRPVRIVIPYSPGSVADVFARIVGQNMAAQWNGSIVVESKSGANGSIAAEEVARSAPDGCTWLLVSRCDHGAFLLGFFQSGSKLTDEPRFRPRCLPSAAACITTVKACKTTTKLSLTR